MKPEPHALTKNVEMDGVEDTVDVLIVDDVLLDVMYGCVWYVADCVYVLICVGVTGKV